MKQKILDKESTYHLQDAAFGKGMISMFMDGVVKVIKSYISGGNSEVLLEDNIRIQANDLAGLYLFFVDGQVFLQTAFWYGLLCIFMLTEMWHKQLIVLLKYG